MKNLKQVFSAVVAMAKAKSTAVKSKTSAMKTRLMIFRLVHNKNLFIAAVAHKVHELKDCRKAIVPLQHTFAELEECDEEEEDDTVLPSSTINYLEEDDDDPDGEMTPGADDQLNLEDEVDHAADLFIRRFHMQMRIQKQESFKRYQEMMERSV